MKVHHMLHKLKTQAALLLACFALTASASRAAEFTILIYETSQDLALRTNKGEAGKKYWASYTQFAGVLAQAGAMRDGAALDVPASKGLQLSGYFKIEAASLAEAKKLAAQAPTVSRGGSVEVRATVANPEMPAK
jgi:hypothetical protein